jgi:hypothetical protein
MEKIMFAKKKGVLLNDEIHEKLLKIQINISFKTGKKRSLHILFASRKERSGMTFTTLTLY